MPKEPLPVHSLTLDERPVQVRPIEYRNPYDFTREHRHTYFEIFFFEKGGGSQLIDFHELPVEDHSCYIVFPQQIHLLKRAPDAYGTLLQFREEVIPASQVRILLKQLSFGGQPAVFFEKDRNQLLEYNPLIALLKSSSEKPTAHSQDAALNFLQALLLQLMENKSNENIVIPVADRKLLFEFQQLLEEQFMYNHLVSKYASSLNSTEKKLSAATKQYLGLSPLQVIHNRILLEAKRLLLFDGSSHKEIAYKLGFDSPASFSLFIKNKTGFNPSELNLELVNFHK